nr:hypothetical protein [Tanacetum cinerariifolium]
KELSWWNDGQFDFLRGVRGGGLSGSHGSRRERKKMMVRMMMNREMKMGTYIIKERWIKVVKHGFEENDSKKCLANYWAYRKKMVNYTENQEKTVKILVSMVEVP